MNTAHLHLMFTHLPIVGLGIAIMINIYSLFKRSSELQKLSLWSYVILGIFALLAYLTGDGAEEIIKTYPGITEDIIENHEHMALYFFIGLMISSAAAMLGLYFTKIKKNLLKKLNLWLLIFAILMSVLAFFTGYTGGEIRHTEINNGVYTK